MMFWGRRLGYSRRRRSRWVRWDAWGVRRELGRSDKCIERVLLEADFWKYIIVANV